MATLLSLSVFVTPDAVLSPSQQYLFSPNTVRRVKAASSKQKAAYPGVNSTVRVLAAVNNSEESVEYLVGETVAAIAAL